MLDMPEIMWHSSSAKLTLNPIRVGSVQLLLDNFETHRVCQSNKQITLPLLLSNRFFTTQILGGHMTSCNQGLSLNYYHGRQRKESLGIWLILMVTKIFLFSVLLLVLSVTFSGHREEKHLKKTCC